MLIWILILIYSHLWFLIYLADLFISAIFSINTSWRFFSILESFDLPFIVIDTIFWKLFSHNFAQILLFCWNFYPLFFSVGNLFVISRVFNSFVLLIMNPFCKFLLVFNYFNDVISWKSIKVILFIHIPFHFNKYVNFKEILNFKFKSKFQCSFNQKIKLGPFKFKNQKT